MNIVSYSDTRARLKEVMDSVVDDHAPVIVTRQNGEPVVMVSLADWRAIDETLHLLSRPANTRRLKGAIRELEAGGGMEQVLDEA